MGQHHELPPGVCSVVDRCPVGQASTSPFPPTKPVARGGVWVRVFSAVYLRFWTYALLALGSVGGGAAVLVFWLHRRLRSIWEVVQAACDFVAIACGVAVESFSRRLRGD